MKEDLMSVEEPFLRSLKKGVKLSESHRIVSKA